MINLVLFLIYAIFKRIILIDFKEIWKQIKASHHDHKHKTKQVNEYETFTFSKAVVGKAMI